MVLSALSGKNPEIRQLGTKVNKSWSFFASLVYLTVSHSIRGDPWSIQMFCVEWKRNLCHDMTTITLPGLGNITICFLSSLTRSKHQQKGPRMSAWSCSVSPPVKGKVLAATVACLGSASGFQSSKDNLDWSRCNTYIHTHKFVLN